MRPRARRRRHREAVTGEAMNIFKLIAAPVVLAAAVIEDAILLVPSKMTDPNHESAVLKAAKFLAEKP
jgi:hypothetical protein